VQVLARNNKNTSSRASVTANEVVSYQKLFRKGGFLPNPTTTAKNQLEAKSRSPPSAGRPGYAAERPERRRRRRRRGRAA